MTLHPFNREVAVTGHTPPGGAGAEAPLVEYRTAPRHRILRRCFARPSGVKDTEGWRAIAYDVSAVGVGVALPLPLQPGTTLEVQAADSRATRPLRARVVYATPLEFVWLCGCELIDRLGDDEMQGWLAGATAVR
jgi:hypothetical protein